MGVKGGGRGAARGRCCQAISGMIACSKAGCQGAARGARVRARRRGSGGWQGVTETLLRQKHISLKTSEPICMHLAMIPYCSASFWTEEHECRCLCACTGALAT